MNFITTFQEIEAIIETIDLRNYTKTRNFKDGSVSFLSPYISRGVISSKYVFKKVVERQLPWYVIEKFVQELAWRDYWQLIWIEKGNAINNDLRHEQSPLSNQKIPKALVEGKTGIEAVDEAIAEFYKTGYMHNHMRMYIASIACNIAQSHWSVPSKWMYGNLLDGDWASNTLSWQWVAGTNSNKKYYANQDNINKYFLTNQKNTFLDKDYSDLIKMAVPEELMELSEVNFELNLPANNSIEIDENKATLVYNFYNLDPLWHQTEEVNRVLLLEPSFFKKYPVNQKVIDFMLKLTENIPNIQIFTGSFDDLYSLFSNKTIIFKEHPTNVNYKGIEEPRDWMFDEVKGYFKSFFSFWKKGKKTLQNV